MSFNAGIYATRIGKALGLANGLDVEGIIFFDLKNIRYLVGFTGSEGALFLSSTGIRLLVDGRYLTQAREEISLGTVVHCRDKLTGLKALIQEQRNRRLAFESGALSHDQYLTMCAENDSVHLVPLRSTDLAGLRAVKDDMEIAFIRKAAIIATEAFYSALPLLRPGIRERDFALELDYGMRQKGADDTAFKTIVASGPNSALPHARPGDRTIQPGDAVIIDWGAVCSGYSSDQTCTLIMGKADKDFRDVHNLVRDARDLAISAIRDGVPAAEIDRVARERIARYGMGEYFSHGTGHGVGLDIHENPRLTQNNDGLLQAGMVVTVEPGVYLPDRWGIRIEDLVLVRLGESSIFPGVTRELLEWEA